MYRQNTSKCHAFAPSRETGNNNIAELLLKRGARVNLADNQRTCPLLGAAYKSDHAMIKLLLSNGANPNVVDLDLQGPCVTLASSGALGFLQGLVKCGADLALRDKWRTHHFGLCSCVWRHGCLCFSRHERIQDLWWGGTPLIGALKSSSSSLSTFLLNYAPDLDLWIYQLDNPLTATAERHTLSNLKRLLRRLPQESVDKLINHPSKLVWQYTTLRSCSARATGYRRYNTQHRRRH